MHSTGIVGSFRFAIAGVRYVIRTQRNIRIQLGVGLGVVILGLWLGLAPTQWAALALATGFVFVCEIGNTVVEVLVDLTCPDYNPLAEVAKDAAAGAVLVASLTAAAAGLLVLGPPLWEKLAGS